MQKHLITRTLLMVTLLWPLIPDQHLRAQQTDIVEPHDVLTVALWNQPELSGKFPVDADGTVAFPLIGRLKAGGLALRALEDTLRRLLSDGYLREPQLTVSVERYRKQTVNVLGEVRQPGSYELPSDATLIEILARAGSTTDRAGAVAVVTRRRSTGPFSDSSPAAQRGPEVIRVDLKALQRGALIENVPLEDGDTVLVPRAEVVYVVGEVKNPGTYTIQSQTTVLQMIAVAGGLTERGSSRRIRIVRQIDGARKEIKAKPDEPLLPGDTMLVGERLF